MNTPWSLSINNALTLNCVLPITDTLLLHFGDFLDYLKSKVLDMFNSFGVVSFLAGDEELYGNAEGLCYFDGFIGAGQVSGPPHTVIGIVVYIEGNNKLQYRLVPRLACEPLYPIVKIRHIAFSGETGCFVLVK
jgi:hypothetical protein